MALGKMTLVILRQNQGLTGSKGRRSQVLPWLEAARLGMEIAAILCEEENPSAVFVHFIIFSCRSSDTAGNTPILVSALRKISMKTHGTSLQQAANGGS